MLNVLMIDGKDKPVRAFIAVGSNVKPRRKNIEAALAAISNLNDVDIRRVSSLYESEPVGGPSQADFLNCVLEINTRLTPFALLSALKEIESQLGRRKTVRWGPRCIDLDIIAMDQLRLNKPTLTIPHPYYPIRRFVLVPFLEIAPPFRHPVLGFTNRELLAELTRIGQRVTMVAQWKDSRFCPSFRKRKTKFPS